MTVKKRSEWSESEVCNEVYAWCKSNGIRGYFRMKPDATMCGTFLAPVEHYYGTLAEGDMLYHRGYTHLYTVSESKLRKFFSRENLAHGYTNNFINIDMPTTVWFPVDNTNAKPYDQDKEQAILCEQRTKGSVYIPGREPEFTYTSWKPSNRSTRHKSTSSPTKAELHARPWSAREDEIIRCHLSEYGDDMTLWTRWRELKGRRRKDIMKRAKELGLS